MSFNSMGGVGDYTVAVRDDTASSEAIKSGGMSGNYRNGRRRSQQVAAAIQESVVGAAGCTCATRGDKDTLTHEKGVSKKGNEGAEDSRRN